MLQQKNNFFSREELKHYSAASSRNCSNQSTTCSYTSSLGVKRRRKRSERRHSSLETSDDEYELPPTDDDGSNYLSNLFSENDEEQHQETDNDRDLPTDPKSANFKEKLCSWVACHKVKQAAVNSLLTDVLPVLPDYSSLKLPKTCRNLLGTSKTTLLKPVEPGSYFLFGLARGINKIIDRYGLKINESLLGVAGSREY